MKKVSVMTMLLMMAFSMTNAKELVKPVFNNFKKEVGFAKELIIEKEMKYDADCSVTLKGKIDLGPVEAEVSCTTTATTCSEATTKAASCLKAAMNTVRSIKY